MEELIIKFSLPSPLVLQPCLFKVRFFLTGFPPNFFQFFPTFLGKHLLNSASTLVLDSLKGLVALNPQLALDIENKGNLSYIWISVFILTCVPLQWFMSNLPIVPESPSCVEAAQDTSLRTQDSWVRFVALVIKSMNSVTRR